MSIKYRILICIGAVLFAVFDAFLTLDGQSAAYWSSGFESVEESNPIGYWFLKSSPSAFIVAIVCWMIAFVTLILTLPKKFSRFLAIAILIGHAFGVATWLLKWEHGIFLAIASLIVMRLFAIPAFDKK